MCPYNFQLKYTTWDANLNFFMNFRVILPYFIDLLNFWRFTSSNSKLNCKCALIWSNKFWKIIFTFHIRNVGSIHKENSISQPFYMISHPCNFDNTLKEIIENEKKVQQLKSFHMEASYVQWFVRKMINWEYHKLEKKIFTNWPISYEDQWFQQR